MHIIQDNELITHPCDPSIWPTTHPSDLQPVPMTSDPLRWPMTRPGDLWPVTRSGDLWPVPMTYDPHRWPMTSPSNVTLTWSSMAHPSGLWHIPVTYDCWSGVIWPVPVTYDPPLWPMTDDRVSYDRPGDLQPLTWCLSVAKSTVARWNLQSGLRPSIVIALSRVLRASSERFRACCTWPRFNIKHSTTWSISTSQLQVPTIDPGAFWDWRWWAPMHTSHLEDKAKVNADYIVSSCWRLNCIFRILLDRQITAF